MSTAEAVTAPIEAPSEKWQPSVQGWVARLLVLVTIFGGLIYLTATLPPYWGFRISLAAIYAIIGISLNVVLGYIGQVSLGHHAFVGVAAFVSAYYVTEKAACSIEQGCGISSFAVGVAFGVLSGAIGAGLLGLVALRIRGLYLALITLTYGFMAERSIFEISFLTRGGAGMPAPRPKGFTSDTSYAFLCLIFLAVVLFIDWRLIRSKTGRAILAVKHSEPVAASYGINVTAYKTLAFVLSGIFAGLAGALFAFRSTNVVSNDFNFSVALLWVLMIVVGGLGNRTGVVIGSAFFALFPFILGDIRALEEFFSEFGRSEAVFSLVLGAALALFTIIRGPGGIGEQISPITRWLRGEKFSVHPEGHGKPKHDKKGTMLSRLGLQKGSEGHAATELPASSEPGSQADAVSEAPPEGVHDSRGTAADDEQWKPPAREGSD